MTAALLTLMKCVRAGGRGGGGGLPPKFFRPFGSQFGPKIRGSPSPEWLNPPLENISSAVSWYSQASLSVEKKISTVRHRTHL